MALPSGAGERSNFNSLANDLGTEPGIETQCISATSPKTHDAVIVVVAECKSSRGLFDAFLSDGTQLVRSSRQPFLDAARALIGAGYSPMVWVEKWRPRGTEFSMRAQLGTAAGLTVDETKTVFAKWKPFPSSAVASPRHFSKTAAATLAEFVEAPSGAAMDERDPPDKKRRPRTGNARALTSLDRAAADSTYPNRLRSSSSRRHPKDQTTSTPASKR
jgi:hypothetical protein